MHRALLIDELLRQIFHFVSDSEDGIKTTVALARGCKAWTDPALDVVWMKLPSVVPLLQLIPSVRLVDRTYIIGEPNVEQDMTRFYSYVGRVKQITHRRSIQVHPELLSFLMAWHSNTPFRHTSILPSLRTVQISSSTYDAFQASLSLSTQLRHLQLDLGFKSRTSSLSDDVLLHYVREVTCLSLHLETVSIRGLASECLNIALSSLQNVKVLSLRLGASLTIETLLAVTSLPCLLEFEVHAAHFDVEDLAELQKSHIFPSLQKLRVRAHASVIELFLHALPDNNLRTLYAEIEDSIDAAVSWVSMFNLICTKSANTLQNLTIERHTELDDLDLESLDDINTHPIAHHNTSVDNKLDIQFANIQILEELRHLRRFVLDTTIPVDICDPELELMLGWWPELEHLDLGSVPITRCVTPPARQPLTSHSLVVIARRSMKLTSLILPVDISWPRDVPMDNLPRQPVLERLTCGYPFPPTHTDLEVAKNLYRLFPSLQTVDGLSHEDQWSQTQKALQHLRGQSCDEF